MRLNNHTARTLVDKWLSATGRPAIDKNKGYLEYATELRTIVESRPVNVPFVHRPEAVAYVRHIARTQALPA